MRVTRYAWVLSPLLGLGGFVLIVSIAACQAPGDWIGRPETCGVYVLGELLPRAAVAGIAALIGAALGAAVAAVIYRQRSRRTPDLPWHGV